MRLRRRVFLWKERRGEGSGGVGSQRVGSRKDPIIRLSQTQETDRNQNRTLKKRAEREENAPAWITAIEASLFVAPFPFAYHRRLPDTWKIIRWDRQADSRGEIEIYEERFFKALRHGIGWSGETTTNRPTRQKCINRTRQTDRQDRQTDGQTDTHKYGKTGRRTYRQSVEKINRRWR